MAKIKLFMANYCQKPYFLTLGIALLNLAVTVNPVKALTFQDTTQGILELRDDDGNIVANGILKYDQEPFEGTFALGYYLDEGPEYLQPIIYLNQPPTDFVEYNSVTIYSNQNLHPAYVNIKFNLGYSFQGSFSEYEAFFFMPPATETAPVGENLALVKIADPRDPFFTLDEGWRFGDVNDIVLEMYSSGFFSFYDLDEEIFVEGDWSARAVIPEPITILGTATALGIGAFFKRKLANK